MERSNTTENNIKNEYCVGCGICSFHDNQINIKSTENTLSNVCPSTSEINEDQIADEIFSNDLKKSARVGYYDEIYSGFVKNRSQRLKSSSGGLATWLLIELMKDKAIDGVVHVGPSKSDEKLFTYQISKTIDEIKSNSKSHYYPTNMKKVLEEIHNSDGKFAVVGVPCYIKGLRLLSMNNENIKKKLKFYFAIFCGHLKTENYAEMIGWQMGIHPDDLKKVDFRVKNNRNVNDYSVEVFSNNQRKKSLVSSLNGTDWGQGLFKPNACEWCDDIAGETADIAFGDAWLDKYKTDSDGRNIIVLRNTYLKKILLNGKNRGKIHLDDETVDDVYTSQAGNYRHRREGLQHRLQIAEKNNIWTPKKRTFKNNNSISFLRKKIYESRYQLSKMSHIYFKEAKDKNNLNLFFLKIFPHQIWYYFLNGRLHKFLFNYLFKFKKFYFK